MTRNSRPWARAQTILLDRPHPAEAAPPLNVEIVAAEERHLLTLYRALAPGTRARGLRYLRLLHTRARRVFQRRD